MARNPKPIIDIDDLRARAKRRLPRALFESIDHGSEADVAMRHNRETLDRIKLVPRVLRDVSGRTPEIKLLGKKQSLPLVIAPTGTAGWVGYRGETALARAAARAGIPYVVPSTSNTPMEQILEHGGGRQWYHAIMFRDRSVTHAAIDRANKAGFEALVVTVDSTLPYNRPRDVKNRLTFPMKLRPQNFLESVLHPHWTFGTAVRYLLDDGHLPRWVNIPTPSDLTTAQLLKHYAKDDAVSWESLKDIRERWPRKLILKGIMHPDDALKAAECGVDAVVASNHGGGSLDSAPSPLEVLPGIAAALNGRIQIMVDSGFRRGSDVLKALALGADAVLIGRGTLYGLAAAGESGASQALSILDKDIRRTMGVIGLSDLRSISRDHVMLPADLLHLGQVGLPWKGPDASPLSTADLLEAPEPNGTAPELRLPAPNKS